VEEVLVAIMVELVEEVSELQQALLVEVMVLQD
jgi:hypothetical protein